MPCIYLPRNIGGMGLTEINEYHRATTISIAQYINNSKDPKIEIVKLHQDKLSQQTSITQLAESFDPGCLEKLDTFPPSAAAKKSRQKFMKEVHDENQLKWKQHARAGKFLKELEKPYISTEASLDWIKKGRLRFDAERMIIAAQDQGLVTNGFKKMAGMTNNDQCRFCHKAVESVNHLVSACQTLLADGYYTKRHNKVCSYLHWIIFKEFEIEAKEIWEHEPQPVDGNEKVTIFYDHLIRPGRYIEGSAIKPDIVVWNKSEKTALIIDVCVPNDYGINRAERKKITK